MRLIRITAAIAVSAVVALGVSALGAPAVAVPPAEAAAAAAAAESAVATAAQAIAPAAAAPAVEDTPSYLYTILDGSMQYRFDGAQSCRYPTEACRDFDGGWRLGALNLRQTEAVDLSVYGDGGEPAFASTDSTVVSAPLSIDGLSHSTTETQSLSGPCGSGSTTVSSGDPVPAAGDPSFLDASIVIAPGTGVTDFDVALTGFEGTEPRFGWLTMAGVHRNSSDRYPSVTETSTRPGGDCWGGSGSALVTLFAPSDFVFAPHEGVVAAEPTLTVLRCDSPQQCVVRAAGSLSWGFAPSYDGRTYSGGGSVNWTFDILVFQDLKQCNDGEVDFTGDLGGAEWVAFTIQANACEGGYMDPGSIVTTNDVVINPSTLAILSFLYTLQYDDDASTLYATGQDATATGVWDLCVSPFEFIPGGKAGAKGVSKLTGWASKFGGSSAASRFSGFVIKHYNIQALKVWTELGGQGEAVARLNAALETAFETTAESGLQNLLETSICVPAWELQVTVIAKLDGSGLIYSYSDTGVLDARVSYEFKAEPG